MYVDIEGGEVVNRTENLADSYQSVATELRKDK